MAQKPTVDIGEIKKWNKDQKAIKRNLQNQFPRSKHGYPARGPLSHVMAFNANSSIMSSQYQSQSVTNKGRTRSNFRSINQDSEPEMELNVFQARLLAGKPPMNGKHTANLNQPSVENLVDKKYFHGRNMSMNQTQVNQFSKAYESQ